MKNKLNAQRLSIQLLIAVSSMFLMESIGSAASVHTSIDDKHTCVNSSDTLSVTGMSTSLAGCCVTGDPSSSWIYDSTDYSWSNNASGTSPTATLDTSAAGAFSPTCALTHHFHCSSGTATTTTTETASASVTVHVNVTVACSLSAPAGRTVGLPNASVRSFLISTTAIPFVGTQTQELTGTFSGMTAAESFSPDGATGLRPCGSDLNEPRSQSSTTVTLSYGGVTWTTAVAGISATASVTGVAFKAIYYQWYKYIYTANGTASFSGDDTYTEIDLGGTVLSSHTVSPYSNTYAVTGSPNVVGWAYSTCLVDCCPSN